MRRRGTQYWLWSNSQLQVLSHDEVLPDGTQIEVQARINRERTTQVFIGVYDREGAPLAEEFHDREERPPLATALVWGCARAQGV